MPHYLLYIILILYPNCLFSQNQYINSFEIAGDRLVNQKKYIEAIQQYEKAILFKKNKTRKDSLYYDISECYYKLNQYPNAIIALQKAIQHSPQLDLGAARYHNNIGYYNKELKYYKKAISDYKKGIKIKTHHKKSVATYYKTIADLYDKLGEYANSVQYYKISIREYEKENDRFQMALTKADLGVVYNNKEVYKEALYYYQESEAFFLTLPTQPIEIVNTYNGLGTTYDGLEQYEKAILYYKKALKRFEQVKDTTNIAKSLNNLGDTYRVLPNWTKAESYLQQSLQLKLTIFEKDMISIASSFDNIGELYLDQQKTPKAIEYYQKAINWALHLKPNSTQLPNQKQLENASNKPTLLRFLTDLGKAYYQDYQNKKDITILKKAYQSYQKADDLIQLLLNDVSEESQLIWVKLTHNIYEKAIQVAYQLYEQEPNKKYIQEAFNFLEHHKAVVLYRASQKNKALPLVQSAEILSNIQQKLTPTDCILAYFVGEKIYTFTITKTEITLAPIQNTVELKDHSAELVQFVKENNQTSDGYEYYIKTAYTLYENLIQPFVTPKYKRLIVIPDDFLYHIPFACLITESQDSLTHITFDLPYLIQQYPITQGHSVGMLLKNLEHTPTTQQQSMAVYAPSFPSSSFNLAPLTATQNNILTLKQILSSSFYSNDVSLDTFHQTHAKHSILYFATHATMDTLNSDLGKIYFSDSVLTTRKLYDLQFNHDLIILGACESGSGQIIQGEGVMSLSRAFMYAGSASVVASLFEVNNQTTTQMMNVFLTQIKSNQTKDIALQSAQKAILTSSQQHPHYWAAFTHTGNWQPLPTASFRLLYYGLGLVILIILGIIGRRYGVI